MNKRPFGFEQIMAVVKKGLWWQIPLEILAITAACLIWAGFLHLPILSFDLAPVIGIVLFVCSLFLLCDQVYRVILVKTHRICLRCLRCTGKDRFRGREKPGTYLLFNTLRVRAVGVLAQAEPGDDFYFVFIRPNDRGKYDMIVAAKAVDLSEDLQKIVR